MSKLVPVITEKSTADVAEGKYTFWVDAGMTKFQARKLIGETFGVDVKKVWVVKKGPKNKRDARRRKKIERLPRKKVVVKLAEKQKIDIFEEKGKK